MSFNLPEAEIRQRLVRLRNLEQLHTERKERNQKLETELRDLQVRYERDMAQRDQLIEKLMLRIGDLEKMVFGSKHNRDNDSASGHSASADDGAQPKQRRLKTSYQRPRSHR